METSHLQRDPDLVRDDDDGGGTLTASSLHRLCISSRGENIVRSDKREAGGREGKEIRVRFVLRSTAKNTADRTSDGTPPSSSSAPSPPPLLLLLQARAASPRSVAPLKRRPGGLHRALSITHQDETCRQCVTSCTRAETAARTFNLPLHSLSLCLHFSIHISLSLTLSSFSRIAEIACTAQIRDIRQRMDATGRREHEQIDRSIVLRFNRSQLCWLRLSTRHRVRVSPSQTLRAKMRVKDVLLSFVFSFLFCQTPLSLSSR